MKATLLLAGVVPAALAFRDTFPVVVWASHKTDTVDALPSRPDFDALLDGLLASDELCSHDAIVLIEQPGLHVSDLRTLSPTSALSKTVSSSPSLFNIPYARSAETRALHSIADTVSSRCNAQLSTYALGLDSPPPPTSNPKHVMCVSMPPVDGLGVSRKDAIADYEYALSSELARLTSAFPKHIVIYTGSPLYPSLSKRQAIEFDNEEDIDFSDPFISPFALPASSVSHAAGFTAPSTTNTSLPTGGILKRYQLLTPALIISLFIAFFVVVPVILLGVKSLTGIKGPTRMDVPKGYSAEQKKNQ